MSRPVTLFTGQWADLDFETICQKTKSFGYDGIEIACWGDHFDVVRALEDDDYCQDRRNILQRHGLECLFRVICGRHGRPALMSVMGHVWTAPCWQGLF